MKYVIALGSILFAMGFAYSVETRLDNAEKQRAIYFLGLEGSIHRACNAPNV